MTTPNDWPHVVRVAVAETKVDPAGRFAVKAALVPGSGPKLYRLTKYVMSPVSSVMLPGETLVLVIAISADVA